MTQAVQDASATEAKAKTVVLSVDAMGGDKGPATVVAGLARFLEDSPDARAILHGPEAELAPLVAKRRIGDRVTIRDARDVVKMTDKPSQVLRSGKETSMWSTIDAVKQVHQNSCTSRVFSFHRSKFQCVSIRRHQQLMPLDARQGLLKSSFKIGYGHTL